MTNKRPGYSHDMGVMTRMIVSMMTWYWDKVRRSRVGIMWADHVSSHVLRSHDHHITIAFFLRRELRWVWKLSVDEWKLGEKSPNFMKETEEENWGKMRTS